MPRFPIVLFDFDGTLVDSGLGILYANRRMLEELGLPPATEAQLRACVGPPLREGFAEILGIPPALLETAVTTYRRWNAHESAPKPVAYPGVLDMLRALRESGVRTAVATCKVEPTARAHAELTGLAGELDAIVGLNLDAGIRSKADVIRALLAHFGAKPGEAVLVGDRKHDCQGAREAGIPCIGVLYGYGDREELEAYAPIALVDSAGDLLKFLL